MSKTQDGLARCLVYVSISKKPGQGSEDYLSAHVVVHAEYITFPLDTASIPTVVHVELLSNSHSTISLDHPDVTTSRPSSIEVKDRSVNEANDFNPLEKVAQSCRTTLIDNLVTPSIFNHLPCLQPIARDLSAADDVGHRRVDVLVTVPDKVPCRDFMELAFTFSQRFFSQYTCHNSLSDLDSACLLQWLAVNATVENVSIPRTINTILAFAETLTEKYRVSRSSDVLFDGLDFLQSTLEQNITDSLDLLYDDLINHYASMLMAGLCPFYTPHLRFDAALRQFEEIITVQPPRLPIVLNNLGIFFMECFEKMRQMDKLDVSISTLRELLASLKVDEPLRVEVLRNLMHALYSRYKATRNYGDLELALDSYREAIALSTSGVGSIPKWSLLLDFAKIAQDADLREIISALRESLQLCPQNHPLRYTVFAHLTDSLLKRYGSNQKEYRKDLDEAEMFAKSAFDHAPSKHTTAKPYFLVRLAQIHSEKALVAENPCEEHFDNVVRMTEEALGMYGKHHTRYLALQLLAVSLIRRYTLRKDVEDLVAARRYLAEALEVTEAGIALNHRAEFLASMAVIHLFPGTHLRNVVDACGYLELCLSDPHRDAASRLVSMSSAFQYMDDFSLMSQEELSRIADVILRAVGLLPEVAHLGLDVSKSLKALREWEHLSMTSSLICTRTRRYQDAVHTIEKGRAIFWSQALKARSRDAANVSPVLNEKLQQLSGEIQQSRYFKKRQGSMPAVDWVRRRRLGDEYESVLKEIQDIPGNEGFAALSLEELMRIGSKGPVVLLASHELECVAYIFVKDGGRELPNLTICTLKNVNAKQLHQYVCRLEDTNLRSRNGLARDGGSMPLRDAVTLPDGAVTEMEHYRRLEMRPKLRRGMTIKIEVLQPVYNTIVKPILAALDLKPSTGRNRPRLWWCPTGVFASLPLHAAGGYGAREWECCSDYVVSSYIPTCTALLAARKAFKPVRIKDVKALVAGAPRPFEGPPLQGAATELKQISDIIPTEQCINLPASDDAVLNPKAGISTQTLLEKLPEASVLHLASHGKQVGDNPLESGFILRDAKITIAQLMPLPLPHAFLAFLSACETARTDQDQTDQVIHLAATMMFAGFKSVIGTMWSMCDSDGPHVASHLYKELFSGDKEYLDPDLVPYALDEALQQLHKQDLSPSRWATFIHLGM